MIPKDARLTEFAGVYRFTNDRYLVSATFAPTVDDFHHIAETVHGGLQDAIDRRAELLDELTFKYSEDIGPRRKRHKSVIRRRRPPKLDEEE